VRKRVEPILRALLRPLGYKLVRAPTAPDWRGREAEVAGQLERLGLRRIQYGCGEALLAGWANADVLDPRPAFKSPHPGWFIHLDLTGPQPFPEAWFECAFAEDFLEHLDPEGALLFLAETRRVLAPGGTLRLSFPGLEGVLRAHFEGRAGHSGAAQGVGEAFTPYDHRHFFSREELASTARGLGYREVRFPAAGESTVPGLSGRETRQDQQALNTCAELVK
jgi:predicted SAM-dependent methyltransferase